MTFEEWMETNPHIPTANDGEANWASWKCGGGPHTPNQAPINTDAKNDSEINDPEVADRIIKIIPGSMASFMIDAEVHRGKTTQRAWDRYREETKELAAKGRQREKDAWTGQTVPPQPNRTIEVVISDVLNDIDN